LKTVHRVTKATDPVISIDPTGSTQQSINSFPAATPRDFDFEVFIGLVLQFSTTEQVPFSLIDAEAFRTVVRCFLHARIFYGSTWPRNIRRTWKTRETHSLIRTGHRMVVHSIK
jgi:hypothetical protein